MINEKVSLSESVKIELIRGDTFIESSENTVPAVELNVVDAEEESKNIINGNGVE